jgi:nitrate reductase alpha subunit
VRVTKAEDGGLGGKGIWKPATTGYTPDNESELMKRYLAGDLTKVKHEDERSSSSSMFKVPDI